MDQGAFGPGLGRALGLADPPTLETQTRRNHRLAATLVRCDAAGSDRTETLAPEAAWLVGLQLRDCAIPEASLPGGRLETRHIPNGETRFLDLRRPTVLEPPQAVPTIYFYLPRATFDELADDAALPRISDLRIQAGVAVSDPVLVCIGAALMPSFGAAGAASRLLVDSVLRAVCAHIAHSYGGMEGQMPMPCRGGLAPWQERRAKELLTHHIAGDISLAELAQACELSVSHFSRAFRRSTGLPPYGWLLTKRVERAKELLRASSLPLAELALAVGFADQSHLTRSFKRRVGTTPGTWRRMCHA